MMFFVEMTIIYKPRDGRSDIEHANLQPPPGLVSYLKYGSQGFRCAPALTIDLTPLQF